jgi:TrmH family RNA methyltransferase
LEPREEGNVGAVCRAMKNFGFADLYLVNPPKLDSEARKFASHAKGLLKKAKKVETFEEAVKGCKIIVGTTGKKGQKNIMRKPISPEQLAKQVGGTKDKVAIVFGRENYGLLNEELDRCDVTMRIHANPKYPILNLAQSVCVVLYELSKKRWDKSEKVRPSATQKDKEILFSYLEEMTGKLYDPRQFHKRDIINASFRRLMGKSFLEKKEAYMLTGLFRKILDRLDDES